MNVFDIVDRDLQRAVVGGMRALHENRAANVPTYYRDESVGDGIVKHMPDGTRFLVALDGREELIIEAPTP